MSKTNQVKKTKIDNFANGCFCIPANAEVSYFNFDELLEQSSNETIAGMLMDLHWELEKRLKVK